MNYFNCVLSIQQKGLLELIQKNKIVWQVINTAHNFNLPNWYVGAGCLAQTIWNINTDLDYNKNIKDIDLVYFDNSDLSKTSELEIEKQIQEEFKYLPLDIDVKNQARVHLWYEKKFNYKIKPYKSTETAINTWPTTATSVAITRNKNFEYKVFAPYGLNDLFGMIVRANKLQITKEIYEKKANRWKKHWPNLTIIPWDKAPPT